MLGPLSLRWVVISIFSLSALLLAGLAVVVYRYRDARGTREFVALLIVTATWSASAAVKLVAPSSVEYVLVALEIFYGALFVAAFVAFASAYTGRNFHETPRFVASVAVLLGATLVLIATNPLHHLLWLEIVPSSAGFPHLVHRGKEPLYWVIVWGSYVFALAGLYFLVQLHFRSRYDTTSTLLIIGGATIAPAVNLVSIGDAAAIPGLDYTPFGLALFGLATTTAIRQDLLSIVPVARDTAVEYSSEGMIICDAERRIRDFNPTAERLFPSLPDDVKAPVESILPAEDVAFDHEEPDRAEITVTSDGEDYDVAVTTAPIAEEGYHLGWSVVLTDITDQKRRQRHLELVARVLRHNMSNEITVIQGQTEILRVHTADEGQRHLDTIVESGRRIIQTSAKLRTIQDIVTDERGRAPTNAKNCVEMVVDRIARDYPDATIQCDAADVWVECTVGLVPAIENLVENAITHNDAPSPTVAVEVTETADGVRFTVADDGPGIPTSEQRILEAGETPLQHSSGVGLWLVYRFVERSGRDLTFRRSRWGGSAVTFVLDRGEPPAE